MKKFLLWVVVAGVVVYFLLVKGKSGRTPTVSGPVNTGTNNNTNKPPTTWQDLAGSGLTYLTGKTNGLLGGVFSAGSGAGVPTPGNTVVVTGPDDSPAPFDFSSLVTLF